MRVLLDTHVLLLSLAQPAKLSPKARRLLESEAQDLLFSAASVWEIAIKRQIGRLAFSVSPAEIVEAARDTGFRELPVRAAHAVALDRLPLRHRDPFDRLLIAQAVAEGAGFLTADRALRQYSDLVDFVE
jgi:PIN domain nuclease of toxin-antitoxin system